MAGYIGSKSSVTLVDGYTEAEADAEFVNDPSSVITVSGSNVGIGTSSPSDVLHVSGGSSTDGILIQNPLSGSFYNAKLEFTRDGTSGGAKIQSERNSAGGVGMSFNYTASNTAEVNGTYTKAMTIDSSGNVGIGTSSVTQKLDIEASTVNTGILLHNTNTTSGASVPIFLASESGGSTTNVSIDNTGSGHLSFRTGATTKNSFGSERMRIDNSGQVGIGTTSPNAGLEVLKSGGGKIRISETAAKYVEIIGYAEGSANGSTMALHTNQAGTSTSTERMRISSSGNLLVSQTTETSGAGKLQISGSNGHHCATFRNGNDGGYGLVFRRVDNTSVGTITWSGSATSYNTSSDYRLKENVVDLTGASARVNQLNPSRFNFIADADTTVDGFLAHEVATVVPEAITGTKDAMKDEEYEVTPAVEATYDEDGNELTAAVEAVMGTRSVPDYQGIDQSKLVPLLTAALQEALTEIASLKTRVEALEA